MTSYWPDDFSHDYHAAAIRLATITENGNQHLLFACVELYPNEIPTPPLIVKRQRKNFGDATVSIGVAVLRVADALAWYESALSGDLKVPGNQIDIPIATLPLLSEPALGRLLIAEEIPFALQWHADPRIHRLVPAEDLPETVKHLTENISADQQAKTRKWIAERMGFDLLAYDDFLCGLALLAPNPMVRGVVTYLKDTRTDGSERLGVKAALRQGMSSETLSTRLQEDRAGGTDYREVKLNSYGTAEIVLPERCEKSGLQLVCSKRGVLAVQTPRHFFRSVHVTSQTLQPQGHVEVPPRRKGEPKSKYPLSTLLKDQRPPTRLSAPTSGALRLNDLQNRRQARTGFLRPDGFSSSAEENERLFINNRSEAVKFVHSLLSNASRQVVFVDPYFDQIDTREFALATRYEGVSVSILTGRDILLNDFQIEDEITALGGDIFYSDLLTLDGQLKKVSRVLPDIRLMGINARNYHDRFLLIDDSVWHFGHSFNQIGKGDVCMAIRLQSPADIREVINEDLHKAAQFMTDWPMLKAAHEKRIREKSRPSRLKKIWQRVIDAVACRK